MTLFFNTQNKKLYTIEIVFQSLTTSRHEPYVLAYPYLFGSNPIWIDTNEDFIVFKPIAVL